MIPKSGCHKSVNGSGHFQGRNAAHIDISLGVPSVMGGLHPNPDAGAAAKKLPDAHGNLGRQRLFLRHNIMQVLPRNAEQSGDFNLLARRGQHILAEQGTGVDGAPIRVSLGDIFSHFVPL
jgi:hypothetical protein